MTRYLLALGFLLTALVSSAYAQSPKFSGTYTPGHAVMQVANGVISDAGGAGGSNTPGSKYLTELGITNTGLPSCINDKLTNAVGGYHQLCFGSTATVGGSTGAFITYNPVGGASPQNFFININGTNFPFPGAGNGNVVGPTSPAPTSGNLAQWNGGTTLIDAGAATGTGPPVRSIGPALTGVPTAPTAAATDNSTQIATDAFVNSVAGPANPTNLYVDNTGTTTTCLGTGTAACNTLQKALNAARLVQFQGFSPTINLASGQVIVGQSLIAGAFSGAANQSTYGVPLIIKGAGSALSVLQDETTNISQCVPLEVGRGAYVTLQKLTLLSACTFSLWVTGGFVEIADDVHLTTTSAITGNPALNLAYAKVQDNGFLLFDGPITTNQQIGGPAAAAFNVEAGILRFFCHNSPCSGVDDLPITGSPTFSSGFLVGINNAVLKTGGRNFTGSTGGPRYALATGSVVDTEQNTANLAGSLPGALAGNASYYLSLGSCMGGAGGCLVVTAPTGLGTGGGAGVSGNDFSGNIVLNTGSAATAASGSVKINTYSNMGSCVATLGAANGSLAWLPTSAIVGTDYSVSASINTFTVNWATNGAALTISSAYLIHYTCATG